MTSINNNVSYKADMIYQVIYCDRLGLQHIIICLLYFELSVFFCGIADKKLQIQITKHSINPDVCMMTNINIRPQQNSLRTNSSTYYSLFKCY